MKKQEMHVIINGVGIRKVSLKNMMFEQNLEEVMQLATPRK